MSKAKEESVLWSRYIRPFLRGLIVLVLLFLFIIGCMLSEIFGYITIFLGLAIVFSFVAWAIGSLLEEDQF